MTDLRVFPWPEQRAVITDLLERIKKLEAELSEIRQQPLVHVDYHTDVASADKALEQYIKKVINGSTTR